MHEYARPLPMHIHLLTIPLATSRMFTSPP